MVKHSKSNQQQLDIDFPNKKYFTIGQVSELCRVKSHVLRYWEQVFPQLEPSKRSGRRYYQRADLELVLEIKSLLQDQGFTISGAKARLSKSLPADDLTIKNNAENHTYHQLVKMRAENQEFLNYIKTRY
ncbi:MAG TPA: MerR family transcriptional regulator [Thiomicrospira sp.]|jgi:DNA-binding transcriptional MerR regulator|nr:MerR family transcriptional regulator [Thiomicrospira sp.]